jgi:hypothetical protein
VSRKKHPPEVYQFLKGLADFNVPVEVNTVPDATEEELGRAFFADHPTTELCFFKDQKTHDLWQRYVIDNGLAAFITQRVAMFGPDDRTFELTEAGRLALELHQPTPTNRGKDVDARMLKKCADDRECHGWSCGQWAKFLKCSKVSVINAPTWKKLATHREALKAQKALDRQRALDERGKRKRGR